MHIPHNCDTLHSSFLYNVVAFELVNSYCNTFFVLTEVKVMPQSFLNWPRRSMKNTSWYGIASNLVEMLTLVASSKPSDSGPSDIGIQYYNRPLTFLAPKWLLIVLTHPRGQSLYKRHNSWSYSVLYWDLSLYLLFRLKPLMSSCWHSFPIRQLVPSLL